MRRPTSGAVDQRVFPRDWWDPASARAEHEAPAERCEACDTPMYGLHCKLVCPNCGYKRDCSDP